MTLVLKGTLSLKYMEDYVQTVVGVRFKTAGKIYYFGQGSLNISEGDYAIVETSQGMECGRVVLGPKKVAEDAYPTPLRLVHRLADASDIARIEENKARIPEVRQICEQKIREHGLDMKLVDVEITFDLSKMIFSFTADGRVDFRNLVRDLASVFRTRIELRQIGVRDQARMLGGVGCCGRLLCCASFLGDFAQVSIRMAKDQNLSLNPTKISGICGRLMCCLKYENDNYCDKSQCSKRREEIKPPTQGAIVMTSEGEGKVISVNPLKRVARVFLTNSHTAMLSFEDIEVIEANGEDTLGSSYKENIRDNRENRRNHQSLRPERPRPKRQTSKAKNVDQLVGDDEA